MSELIPKPVNAVALPTVPHGMSLGINNELSFLHSVLNQLIEAGNERNCVSILELVNTFNRAKFKFDQNPAMTKDQLRQLVENWLALICDELPTLELCELHQDLLRRVERLRNENVQT